MKVIRNMAFLALLAGVLVGRQAKVLAFNGFEDTLAATCDGGYYDDEADLGNPFLVECDCDTSSDCLEYVNLDGSFCDDFLSECTSYCANEYGGFVPNCLTFCNPGDTSASATCKCGPWGC
jgi:hypothetical protein